MKLYRIESNEKNKKIFGIDSSIELGDIDKIEIFKNINYVGETNVDLKNRSARVHKIVFSNLDDNLNKYIFKNIDKWLEDVLDSSSNNITVASLLSSISQYFKTKSISEITNKLLGDMGEVIFINILQNYAIDYQKYYQASTHSVFDFTCLNNKYLDVKTTSPAKKSISINLKQIQDIDKCEIFVIEISKKSGNLNILNLIDNIIIKNEIISNMYIKWSEIYKSNQNIINSWTIDLNNMKYYFLNKKAIPILKIENNGSLLNANFEISTAGHEDLNIKEKILNLFK